MTKTEMIKVSRLIVVLLSLKFGHLMVQDGLRWSQKSHTLGYFISSLGADAEQALKAVRGHWAIENELHWCLDIGFGEDECQVREAVSAENLATIRHIGVNLLKQEKSCKLGLKSKRKKAGWDEGYLLKVLKK